LEYELIDQADETWVVSPTGSNCSGQMPHKSVQLVSNIVDVPLKDAVRASARLSLHRRLPAQAKHRCRSVFVQKIYPLVNEHLRDAKFYIIGGKPPRCCVGD
jgi:hypothetical protein